MRKFPHFLIVIVVLVSCKNNCYDKKVVKALNEVIRHKGYNYDFNRFENSDSKLISKNKIWKCIMHSNYSGEKDSCFIYFDTLGRIIRIENSNEIYGCDGSIEITTNSFYENGSINTICDYDIWGKEDTVLVFKEKHDRLGRLIYRTYKKDSLVKTYTNQKEVIYRKEYHLNTIQSLYYNEWGLIYKEEDKSVKIDVEDDTITTSDKVFYKYNNKEHILYAYPDSREDKIITAYKFDSAMNLLQDDRDKYEYNQKGKLISKKALYHDIFSKWEYDSLSRLIYDVTNRYTTGEITKIYYKYNSLGLLDTVKLSTNPGIQTYGITTYTYLKR